MDLCPHLSSFVLAIFYHTHRVSAICIILRVFLIPVLLMFSLSERPFLLFPISNSFLTVIHRNKSSWSSHSPCPPYSSPPPPHTQDLPGCERPHCVVMINGYICRTILQKLSSAGNVLFIYQIYTGSTFYKFIWFLLNWAIVWLLQIVFWIIFMCHWGFFLPITFRP